MEKRKISRLAKTAIVIFAVIAVLVACGAVNKPESSPDWESTSYSLDELKSMALEMNSEALDYFEADDGTKEALKAYNIMLGYVENVIGLEYRLYDFYCSKLKVTDRISRTSYVIKIVLEAYAEDVKNDESLSSSDPRIIMITCDDDGSNLESQLEPFLMARRWTNELDQDLSEEFPEYHMNTDYIAVDYIVPNVKSENYSEPDDYTHFYKEDFYTSPKTRNTHNTINVIVPPETKEEDAQRIFDELEPILKKYCVTYVYIVAPANDEVMQQFIEEEKMTSNSYSTTFDDLAWMQGFKIEG